MQVIIDEVISRIRAVDGGSNMSPQTLRTIISAVVEAVDEKERQRKQRDEEHSLRNYQQRNQPWER